MKIIFNCHAVTVENSLSLAVFLEQQSSFNPCFAVAINRIFIPKSHYHSTFLKEGDEIDMLTPMQGG